MRWLGLCPNHRIYGSLLRARGLFNTLLERCRSLADSLRARGCAGILAPSSAAPGDKNLAIYIDGIAGNVTLEAGADRLPL